MKGSKKPCWHFRCTYPLLHRSFDIISEPRYWNSSTHSIISPPITIGALSSSWIPYPVITSLECSLSAQNYPPHQCMPARLGSLTSSSSNSLSILTCAQMFSIGLLQVNKHDILHSYQPSRFLLEYPAITQLITLSRISTSFWVCAPARPARPIAVAMKGTKVQTLGGRAVAGAWLVAWAIMAMGAIINTHAHR